jgi:hypothetical protein
MRLDIRRVEANLSVGETEDTPSSDESESSFRTIPAFSSARSPLEDVSVMNGKRIPHHGKVEQKRKALRVLRRSSIIQLYRERRASLNNA